MVSEGSETCFFKRRFRNVCMIRFESYGDWKLDELGPLFCYRRFPEVALRCVDVVSDGFQRGFRGSETPDSYAV